MNQELAAIFYEIADILEMKKVQWKPAAYRKAARALESLGERVEEIYEKEGQEGLEEIPGVGEALAMKIIEYIKTGKIRKLIELRKSIPKGIQDLMKVQGIGPKKAMKLHEKLGVRTVKQLEKAAKKHKVAGLETFKEKSEENILEGIKFMRKSKGRVLLAPALLVSRYIENKLKDLREVREAITAGSVRRMEETVGDIDILVISKNNKKVVDFFTKLPLVKRILAKGSTKAMIITKDNMQVDIRIIKPESFGAALQYFTGNKSHNIHLRKIAIKKKLKLSEYGIFKGKRLVAGRSEEGIYKKLGMQYIPPELRTERGEIEAALKRKIPKILDYKDVKGDLHCHTKWSDGSNSVEEMARAAKQLGYKYIAVTDHGNTRQMMQRIDEKKLLKQVKEIDKLNKKSSVKVLKGIEVDIKADGSLGLSDSVLKKLDLVIAAVHSGFRFPKAKQTERILKAMDNPYVNILAHPLNRLIKTREPINLDFGKICQKAKEKKIALEINASSDRLDLPDAYVKEAISKGVKLAIGTDAHSKDNLKDIELGTAVARRGWAQKKDVLNCLNLAQLKKFLRR